MDSRTYIAIDLKSFYASVECVARGLDPLTTNLVVADASRTEKTICLAVTPSLKAYGISGRARLFEVVQQVKKVNDARLRRAPGHQFSGVATHDPEVQKDPSKALGYLIAPPRMAHYIQVSTQIYNIYLKYVSSDDIHVYSIDEVFIDATQYLRIYNTTAHDLAMKMIRDVLAQTGITATAGIGTNLFLSKIAMDIEAKHSAPDKDGVRIAALDEMSFRQKYWSHRPLTDFWRIGRGLAKRLEDNGMYTLGDVARRSLQNEDFLYKLFGVNAELIIDHAWGWEPCTIADVKGYRPEGHSLSNGQVLSEPYTFAKARTVILEMTDLLVMEMVSQKVVADQMVLTIGYDTESLTNPEVRKKYRGPVTDDWYGRPVPKPAHGSINLGRQTSSTELIMKAVGELFDRITDKNLLVRRMYVVANHVVDESSAEGVQLDLFQEEPDLDRERSRQEAILKIRQKFGKNAILKGMNFEEGATAKDRNKQIGGHKA
ncbi:MAG: DNA methylase [Bacteroidales bacterium]|nr:DNA methylase [Bacteroidales bacterium]